MNNFQRNIYRIVTEPTNYSYLMYDGSNQPGENATCTGYWTGSGVWTLYSTNSVLALNMVLYIDYAGVRQIYNGNGFVHYFPTENKLVTISTLGVVTAINDCTTELNLEIGAISNQSQALPDNTCAFITDNVCWINTTVEGRITSNDVVYMDSEGMYPFAGGSQYYKININTTTGEKKYVVFINDSGVIQIDTICF